MNYNLNSTHYPNGMMILARHFQAMCSLPQYPILQRDLLFCLGTSKLCDIHLKSYPICTVVNHSGASPKSCYPHNKSTGVQSATLDFKQCI